MRIDVLRRLVLPGALALIAGCSEGSDPSGPEPLLTETPFDITPLGQGSANDRFTAELWVRGNTAYTSTWGTRTTNGTAARGNAIKIWDVGGTSPVLVDSLIVPGASTLGDVQVSADGRYLVVATEFSPGSIVIYDLSNPRKPVLVSRFQNADTDPGVHTAEVQQVDGRLYAFLSIDPRGSERARLVIVDITNPAAPSMVMSRVMGSPFVHDVFVRDGILMTALWDDGVTIWDIGGGSKGGTISNPVQIGNVRTKGGKVHNIYWFRDQLGRSSRYAIVGEEGPASIPSSASGDVHVIDVSDMANPREVAFLTVPNAGVHNFSSDDSRGILYMAYYNAGVRALSIRGDLGSCTSSQKSPDGRCDLSKMNRLLATGPVGIGGPVFVWGVHFEGGRLFASDMLNGLWRLSTVPEF
jgi:hypothetical protein